MLVVFTFLLENYRRFLSPILARLVWWPGGCRFYPTCSDYGLEAVRQYGLMVGFVFLLKRLGRCRPGGAFGYDPLPPRAARH